MPRLLQVGVHSALANKVMQKVLEDRGIAALGEYVEVRSEVALERYLAAGSSLGNVQVRNNGPCVTQLQFALITKLATCLVQ